MATRTFFKISVLLTLSGLVAGCATVSVEQPKSYSTAISDHIDTALGEYAAMVAAHARGGYGFYPLDQGMNALGMRLHLAEIAQKRIDLQYFLLKTDSVFVDFDILAVGPIAVDISASFDEYWNHSRAVPIDQFIEDPEKEDLETVRAEVQENLDVIYDTVYEKALDSQLLKDLMSERQPLFSGQVRLLADSPDKLINQINATHMRLAMELREVVLSAEKEILLISPYYVPGDRGVQLLRDLVAKGVRVMILTNSLASTNHVPVHSGYARYRLDVIEAGAEFYEARANAARQLNLDKDGPKTLTLRAKLFVIDRRKRFVGSLNLDPGRSNATPRWAC